MDFEIGNETSSDEYIPPAPQFCQRVDEITATNISRGKTGEELFKLGAEIQLKLNQSREKDKQKNLVNMNEQVQLSQILTEYFQLDETAQKARLLDILLELEWIRPGHRKSTPGNPLTWKTTNLFLDYFNLKNISDLPGIEDLKNSGLLDKNKVIFNDQSVD